MEIEKEKETLPNKSKKMTDYLVKRPKKYLEKIVSKLAIDGITFRTICENEELREAFKASGYQWPKSHNTVRSLIMKHYRYKVNRYRKYQTMNF